MRKLIVCNIISLDGFFWPAIAEDVNQPPVEQVGGPDKRAHLTRYLDYNRGVVRSGPRR